MKVFCKINPSSLFSYSQFIHFNIHYKTLAAWIPPRPTFVDGSTVLLKKKIGKLNGTQWTHANGENVNPSSITPFFFLQKVNIRPSEF